MKHNLLFKILTAIVFLLIGTNELIAQVPFAPRQSVKVKGDLQMIGNSILGLTNNPPNDPYNTLGTNNGGEGFDTAYIDIDGNNTTFSSSSADLIDQDQLGCSTIAYAGLYWSANYYLVREDIVSSSSSYALLFNSGPVTGEFDVNRSNFDNDISTDDLITANLVLAESIEGCSEFSNSAAMAGNIAVIRRGGCSFTQKIINAQNAGAIGVIVVNTNGETLDMTGTPASQITIPSGSIGNNDIGGLDLIDIMQNNTGTYNVSMGSELVSNVRLTVNNTSIAGVYPVGVSSFGSDDSDLQLIPASSNLVVAQPEDGCGLTNTSALSGNIAVIREGGSCTIREKVINAQNANALAVVIIGNSGAIPTLDGDGPVISIPTISLGNDDIDGADLITLLNAQDNVVNATVSTSGNEVRTDLPLSDVRLQGNADYRNILLGYGASGSVDYISVQPQIGTDAVDGVSTNVGVLFDGYANTPSNPSNTGADNVPYVCYADVTDFVKTNGFGTYTVGNMKATVGNTSGVSGAAGGWTLVVIYENQKETPKVISINDGFLNIQAGATPNSVNYTITGFRTLPTPLPVNGRFGIATLEGDNGLQGDNLLIENSSADFVPISNAANPENNFFNSSISINGTNNQNRNPASINTLGFDIDLFEINNPANVLIDNDKTSVAFRLTTDGDSYTAFLNAFAIEDTQPEITIARKVYDASGTNDISGNDAEPGDILIYDLEIKNSGSENFRDASVVLKDILPANVNLVEVVEASLPSGISYTEVSTGNLQFNIPSDLLELSDDSIFIRIETMVVPSCDELRETCSNILENLVTISYIGESSGIEVVDDSAIDTFNFCGLEPEALINTLINIPPCQIDTSFCGGDLTLVAGDGYDQYDWIGPGGFSTTTTDSFITIPNVIEGVYQVTKIDNDPSDGTCMTLQEEFNVQNNSAIEHPLQDNAATDDIIDYFESCAVPLAKINLCGTQSYVVDSGFDSNNLDSITWQKLNNETCFDRNDECPAVESGCELNENWTTIATDPLTTSLSVSDPGEYRMVVEFLGGCVSIFYFDVNKNEYQPVVDIVPMSCGTDGSVTVNNIASPTFRFLIQPQSDPEPSLQQDIDLFTNDTGVFTIPFQNDPYVFTVYALDTALPNCIFSVDGTMDSFSTNFDVQTTAPICPEDFGSILITVTDGIAPYTYTLDENIIIGPTDQNVVTFTNVSIGDHLVNIIDGNQCENFTDVTITATDPIVEVFRTETPVTCGGSGIITDLGMVELEISGGSGNYIYTVVESSNVSVRPLVPAVTGPGSPNPNTTSSTSVSFDGLNFGQYYVFVEDVGDSAGCSLQSFGPYNIFSPPNDLNTIVYSSSTCSGGFELEIQVAGGTGIIPPSDPPPGFDIRLVGESGSSGIFQPLNDLSGPPTAVDANTPIRKHLYSGLEYDKTYIIEVRDNVTNCLYQELLSPVALPSTLDIVAIDSTDANCDGPTGVISVTATGGSGFYEYALSNNGGQQIYDYQSSSIFVDLAPDTYIVFVRDGNSPFCEVEGTIVVDQIDEPLIAIIEGGNLCYDSIDLASQWITVVPGINSPSMSFEYVLDDGAGSQTPVEVVYLPNPAPSNTFEIANLTPATYTVFIRNRDTQCTSSEINFTIESELEINTVLAKGLDCSVNPDAIIESMITGGNGVDLIEVNTNNAGYVTVAGGFPFTTSTPGSYQFRVIDQQGCIAESNTVVVDPISFPEVNTTVTGISCNGDADGTITITIDGTTGTPPYETSLDGSIYTNQTVYTGLMAGTYSYFVRDANQCIVNQTVTIAEIPTIVFDTVVTPITTEADGAIEVNNTTGGTGTYEYELSTSTSVLVPYQANNVFVITTPGTYTLSVRDSNGCEVNDQITLLPAEDEHPITDYADEILFCAITGQSYPVVTIENENGEALDLPYVDVLSIVWEKLDDISCSIELEENCPTTDSSCSSDWFEICTGPSCTITDIGEYRVVVQFANKTVNSTQIYYFKAEGITLSTDEIEDQKIRITPNPAVNIVQYNGQFSTLELYDMTGKKVLETSSKMFDVSALESGMYFVRVMGQTGKETIIKLMKR